VKENNKIISENELPFSVPNADHAWEEMRKLLDEDRPEVVPVLPLGKPGFSTFLKYFTGAAILLLIVSVAYLTIRPSNNNNSPVEKIVDAQVKPEDIFSDSGKNSSQSQPALLNNNQGHELSTENNAMEKGSMNVVKSGGSLIKSDHTGRIIAGETGSLARKNDKGNSDKNKILIGAAGNKKGDQITNAEKPESTIADRYVFKPSVIPAPGIGAAENDSSNKKLNLTANDTTALATENPAPHIELPAEKWTINTGLHWTIPIPLNGGSNYFIGPNGQSQPYSLLLPGAWIQAEKEKQLVTFDVNPFAVSLPPAKVFRTITGVENVQDTLVQTTDQRTLIKTFGLSAGVSYQYKIFSNWWAGAGVQMVFWKRAVAGSAAAINKVPIGGTAGVITNQQSVYKLTDEWSYFSKVQASISTEIFYKAPKWQAGLRLGLPITPLAQQDGPKYFLRGELLYRLHLTQIHLR
jgi:hypothetical protein